VPEIRSGVGESLSTGDQTIPGAHVAFVPEEKLRGYLLNPQHADGTHKFRVFRSAFGVGPEDWEQFGAVLVDGLQRGTVTETRDRTDCTVYGVSFMLEGLDGQDKRVITSWKVPKNGDPPSLVTAYLDV
jgi:hypothetical protein